MSVAGRALAAIRAVAARNVGRYAKVWSFNDLEFFVQNFQALDSSLSRGETLPSAWTPAREPPAAIPLTPAEARRRREPPAAEAITARINSILAHCPSDPVLVPMAMLGEDPAAAGLVLSRYRQAGWSIRYDVDRADGATYEFYARVAHEPAALAGERVERGGHGGRGKS